MKNMKKRTVTWLCLLFSLLMCTSAKAESITSPNGLLKLSFTVNAQGEPVYELSYNN